MSTWEGPPPPVLPRPGPLRALVGGLRIGVLGAWLAVMTALYALLKVAEPLFLGTQPRFLVMRLWARVSLRLIGLRRVVHGTPLGRGGAMVANHSSWLDVMALCSIGQVAFVAKAEVRDWPGIGFCARLMDALFVERRAAAAAQQKRDMTERIDRGQQLLFFPEGTSTDGLRVLPFKSALFAAFHQPGLAEEMEVQPVALAYVPNARLPASFYGWWGDMSLGAHIWAMVTRSFGGEVHLSFADPVRPAAFIDRKALAAHCETAVRDGWARFVAVPEPKQPAAVPGE